VKHRAPQEKANLIRWRGSRSDVDHDVLPPPRNFGRHLLQSTSPWARAAWGNRARPQAYHPRSGGRLAARTRTIKGWNGRPLGWGNRPL